MSASGNLSHALLDSFIAFQASLCDDILCMCLDWQYCTAVIFVILSIVFSVLTEGLACSNYSINICSVGEINTYETGWGSSSNRKEVGRVV